MEVQTRIRGKRLRTRGIKAKAQTSGNRISGSNKGSNFL